MKVYFLSGLGADKTVFQFLTLNYCEPVFLDWITPDKNESLVSYALRLKAFYNLPDNAVIAGLSFGGMLATELAKEFPGIKAILISSAKTRHELPAIYRTGKYLSLHSWTSPKLQRWFMLNIKWLFGLKTPEYISVYEELIQNSDTAFNKWAVSALLRWDNLIVPQNIKHIHGTSDRILPYKQVTCDVTIKAGGHLMVMEQAETVSAILRDFITSGSALSSLASQSVHRFQA